MKSLHIIMLSLAIILSLSLHSGAQINHTVHVILPGNLPPPSICMVTVDPVAEKDMIIWEKTYGIGISSYNVYREVKFRNNYVFMGNVPFINLSVFTDLNSFPERQQYRYKISAIDICGNESEMSQDIKPFFLSGVGCSNGNCLQWINSKENDVDCVYDSVIIYKGTDPFSLSAIDTIPAIYNSYTDRKENLRIYYRIAGIKEKACDPGKISDNGNIQISHDLVLSNIISIYSNTPDIVTINYQDKISVSPNPFETETLLKWENNTGGNSDLFIYDLKGRLIKEVLGLEKNEYRLQKENLPVGCYIIEIKGNKRYYGKIFVI